MFKVDIQSLILMSVFISMFTEYFVHQHMVLKFETWLMNYYPFWHKFFFCRFCFIGKMSMLMALCDRPVMFLEPLNYWLWTFGEWFINFMVINWISLVIDGNILQAGLSHIVRRQDYEVNMVLDADIDKN